MPLPAIILLIVSLGIYLVPVYLLRRRAYARTQDYFVSSEHTPPSVIQNSSIAYALQMATFGPFFGWGASGDFWPAIIYSAFFGSGVCLIYVLRRPMLAFLDDALSKDRSITVHAFISRQHGNDPRVRVLASGLTVFALLGLVTGEAVGVATLLKPFLLDDGDSAYLLACGLLMLMALCALLSGNSGVMRSVQSQLGMIYFGLFGSTALLLYLQVSALRTMPPHGTFAIVYVVACCTIMFCYRRSRYVDTSPIRTTNSKSPDDPNSGREPIGVRLFRRYEKILNACISTFSVLVIVVGAMEFYSEGLLAIARDSAAALWAGTRVSTMGLIALALLALFYPIVDLTNWQRIAAFEQDKDSIDVAPSRQPAALRRLFRIYAMESSLVLLFMCMFGAIAVVSTTTPVDADADAMQVFLQQLASQQNLVATCALSLLLVSVFAIALSTMSSMFSASLCAIHYDILTAFWPAPVRTAPAAENAIATRRTILAGCGLCLVMLMGLYITGAYLRLRFTGRDFLALLFAFYCVQLSFVPLVLGPVIARTRGGYGTVSPAWALVILAAGAAIGIGVVTVYVATGDEPWLWAAVPACLGSGLLLFTIARLWPTKMPGAA